MAPKLGWNLKTADKLNQLKRSPDKKLQTPEGQMLLRVLEEYHKEKTDPLMPFLVREWKKGRIKVEDPRLHEPGFSLRIPARPGYDTFDMRLSLGTIDHWADWYNSRHPTRLGVELMRENIQSIEQKVTEWDAAMQEKATQEAEEKAANHGQIVHETPDGYTVRRLTKPEELRGEGDAMGHCIGGGGYDEDVRNGNLLVYSLRDAKGKPHATLDISPTRHFMPPVVVPPDFWNGQPLTEKRFREIESLDQCDLSKEKAEYNGIDSVEVDAYDQMLEEAHEVNPDNRGSLWDHPLWDHPIPEGGTLNQIQGKGNGIPKPEYQKQLKHWFETMKPEDRPGWADMSSVGDWDAFDNDPDDQDHDYMMGSRAHGDYGLRKPPLDHEALLNSAERKLNTYDDVRGSYYVQMNAEPMARQIYDASLEQGTIPELAKATEAHGMNANDSLEEWMNMNYSMLEHPYPQEEDFPNDEAYFAELKDYDEERAEWADSHAGSLLNNAMYKLIQHHWDDNVNNYVNEPIGKSKVKTFSHTTVDMSDTPNRGIEYGQPLIFDHDTQTLYVGADKQTHSELSQSILDTRGTAGLPKTDYSYGRVRRIGGVADWWGLPMPEETKQKVLKEMNWSDPGQDEDWRISNEVATEIAWAI